MLKRALIMLLIVMIIRPPHPAWSITIQEEEKLGKEFMDMALRQYPLIEDPAIVDYVNAVGRNILSVMPDQPFAYRFFIVRQDVFNAFAGPAGHIFINSGLMEAMTSEDELAGILAHEIIHVSARHISRKIARSSKIGLAALAGMIAGIFLGIGGAGAAAANAVSIGSAAAARSAGLAYSRQDEMQADEIGIGHLAAAGYSGAGLLTILKKIRDHQWFGSEQVPSYLMTHPAVEDRIAYLDGWMGRTPDAVKTAGKNAEAFDRFRTRLIAAYGDREKALSRMTAELREAPDDPRVLHGYAISLARSDKMADALVFMKTALQKRPFDPVMLKDLGEMYFIDARYRDAIGSLEGSIGIHSNDWEAHYLLGRARIGDMQYTSAVDSLKRALVLKPDHPPSHYALGDAYGKMGETGDAHYHLGLYSRARGDFQNARFHLTQAEKAALDPERMAKVSELLKEIRKKIADTPAPPIGRSRMSQMAGDPL